MIVLFGKADISTPASTDDKNGACFAGFFGKTSDSFDGQIAGACYECRIHSLFLYIDSYRL